MRYALNKLFVLMVWMLAAFASSAVFAANPLEKLMMPGELSSAHAKFEVDCTNCHKLLAKKAQSNLCISCHTEIKSDLDKKSGFHGRNKIVAKSECYACHVEHQGRSVSIVQLEPAIFNHTETNYPLEGGHKVATCVSCRVAGKKFREAKHDCLSCHDKDQPHKGNLGKQCET